MFSAKEQTLSSLQRSLNIDPNVVCYIEIAKLHVQMDQMRSSKCKEVGDEISAKRNHSIIKDWERDLQASAFGFSYEESPTCQSRSEIPSNIEGDFSLSLLPDGESASEPYGPHLKVDNFFEDTAEVACAYIPSGISVVLDAFDNHDASIPEPPDLALDVAVYDCEDCFVMPFESI